MQILTKVLTLALFLGGSEVNATKINYMTMLDEQSKASVQLLAQDDEDEEAGVGAIRFNPTCNFAIRRANDGPDNWTKYIGKGREFSDSTMPADSSMIVWTKHARTDFAAMRNKISSIRSFKRPSDMERNPSLWGSRGVHYHDVVQGANGDCYMVAVASSLAEYDNRVKNMFIQQTYNDEGIFAIKLFVKGKPTIITVDDRMA